MSESTRASRNALHTHLLILATLHGFVALIMVLPLYVGIKLLIEPIPIEALDFQNPASSLVGVFLIIITGGLILLLYFFVLPLAKAIFVFMPYLLVGIGLMMVPNILAMYGLVSRRNWARILSMVLFGAGLLFFPMGTAAGAYAFWVLLSKETVAEFQQGQAAPIIAPKAAPKGLFLKDE